MGNPSLKMFFNTSTWHDFLGKYGRNLMRILGFKSSSERINKSFAERIPRFTIKGMLTVDVEMVPDVCSQENMAFMTLSKETHHFCSCSINKKRLREGKRSAWCPFSTVNHWLCTLRHDPAPCLGRNTLFQGYGFERMRKLFTLLRQSHL